MQKDEYKHTENKLKFIPKTPKKKKKKKTSNSLTTRNVDIF